MRRLLALALVALVFPAVAAAQTGTRAAAAFAGGWNLTYATADADVVVDLLIAVDDDQVVGSLGEKRIEDRVVYGTLMAKVLSSDPNTLGTTVIVASVSPDGSLTGTHVWSSDSQAAPVQTVVPFVATRPSSGLTTLEGRWRTVVVNGPLAKTFHQVILDLRVDGDTITGTATMGHWPGVCELSGGRLAGNDFSFVANGALGSSSGYPRIPLIGTINGDQMTMTFTWGFVGGSFRPGPRSESTLQLIGKRIVP